MRKAERLFQILTILRGRRTVITALKLADLLEVSERTIYRDMQTLSLSGMPIESEAGVGYKLKANFTIPPLMFDEKELEALLLGARMVESWSGQVMAKAAKSALTKIHAVLPEQLHQSHVQKPEWLIVPDIDDGVSSQFSDQIGEAIKKSWVLNIRYQREDKAISQRLIWPLGLLFWGNKWTLVAWCQLRAAYRMFRLDRIIELELTHFVFQQSDNCNLQHYIQQCAENDKCLT